MRYEKEMKMPVTRWLNSQGFEVGYELLIGGYADVIGFEFEKCIGRKIPRLKGVVVVELKLRDIKGVICQARGNKYHIGESWAAMPKDFCDRMSQVWIHKFMHEGIGLLSVNSCGEVEVIIRPSAFLGFNNRGRWLQKKCWRVHRQNERKLIKINAEQSFK